MARSVRHGGRTVSRRGVLVGVGLTSAAAAVVAALLLAPADRAQRYGVAPFYTDAHAGLLIAWADRLPREPMLSAELAASASGPALTRATGARSFAGQAQETVPERIRAEARVREEGSRVGTYDEQAAVAVADLLVGNSTEAVARLWTVQVQDPADPRVLNDLAAALVLRGRDPGRTVDLLDALTLTERAISLESRGLEAAFNRALILEELGLNRSAKEQWADYRRLDGASPWAERARRHEVSLDQPSPEERWADLRARLPLLIARDRAANTLRSAPEVRELALRYAERELLTTIARSVLEGDPAAYRELLRVGRWIAAGIPPEQGGGPLLSALDTFRTGSEAERAELARGLGSLGRGRLLYEETELEGAEIELERARRIFRSLGSPFQARAQVRLALCRYQQVRYAEARATAEEVVSDRDLRRDPWALGQSHELIGLLEGIDHRPGRAAAHYRSALELYERTGWPGKAASAHLLLAEVLELMGLEEDAWQHRGAALAQVDRLPEPTGRLRIWSETTGAALDRGGPQAAKHFAEQLMRAAESVDRPSAGVVAYLRSASVLGRAGEIERALGALREAERWTDQVVDRALAEVLLGDVYETRGEVLASVDPLEALHFLDRSEEIFRATGATAELPDLLALRAEVHRALSDPVAADRDLRGALALTEDAAEDLSDPVASSRFAERSRPSFDRAIAAYVETGRTAEALDLSERVKRLRFAASAPGPASVAIRPQPGTLLLFYHFSKDRLLRWSLRPDGESFSVRHVGEDRVEELIRASNGAPWQEGEGGAVPALLSDLLLGDVAGELGGSHTLVVVPDGPLRGVLFAALLHPRTGRYLVHSHRIVTAPTLLHAAGIQGALEARFSPRSTVLAMGNPKRSGSGVDLQPLPDAEEEVAEIARHFPRTSTFVGSEASSEVLLREIGSHEVFHYAGHAVLNSRDPARSRLFLAASETELDGSISVRELVDAGFAGPRLVVLSACGSGLAASDPGSVAEAFSLTGVPLVIGAVREVEDRHARTLFREFYSRLSTGLDPVNALRQSQLTLLESPEPGLASPATWAPFHLVLGQPRL